MVDINRDAEPLSLPVAGNFDVAPLSGGKVRFFDTCGDISVVIGVEEFPGAVEGEIERGGLISTLQGRLAAAENGKLRSRILFPDSGGLKVVPIGNISRCIYTQQ
jgi:hypothetical protein